MSVTGPVGMLGKEERGAAANEAADGAAAAAGWNFSTSLDVIIPSIPDPDWIWERSIPFSAASLLAAGLANTLPPEADTAGLTG